MIAIVDYGAGNLQSVVNAFEAIGQHPRVVTGPEPLADAAAIVLPGVGAFGDGMAQLRRLDVVGALRERVIVGKTPFLGICLGMQFLAQVGLEHGEHQGLGWIDGTVERLKSAPGGPRVPHIGWNAVHMDAASPLFEGLPPDPVFYFVHSYHLALAPRGAAAMTSWCDHGQRITASVQQEHVFGVQFHPEKSQRNGLTLLENFVRAAGC